MATVIKDDKYYQQQPTKSDIFIQTYNTCRMKKGLDGFWRPPNQYFAFGPLCPTQNLMKNDVLGVSN